MFLALSIPLLTKSFRSQSARRGHLTSRYRLKVGSLNSMAPMPLLKFWWTENSPQMPLISVCTHWK